MCDMIGNVAMHHLHTSLCISLCLLHLLCFTAYLGCRIVQFNGIQKLGQEKKKWLFAMTKYI